MMNKWHLIIFKSHYKRISQKNQFSVKFVKHLEVLWTCDIASVQIDFTKLSTSWLYWRFVLICKVHSWLICLSQQGSHWTKILCRNLARACAYTLYFIIMHYSCIMHKKHTLFKNIDNFIFWSLSSNVAVQLIFNVESKPLF
jgi:hypothetical protein